MVYIKHSDVRPIFVQLNWDTLSLIQNQFLCIWGYTDNTSKKGLKYKENYEDFPEQNVVDSVLVLSILSSDMRDN